MKYKVKSLSAVIGGKKFILKDEIDSAKMPKLKDELAAACKAGYLVEVKEPAKKK